MADGRIGLREAVEALRAELGESIAAGANQPFQFEVGEINLVFQVAVERVAEGSAGIRFWVVDIGGKTSASTTTTHSIAVPLRPVLASGGPVLTGSAQAPD